jgi:fructosamine-3-kinase
VTVADRVAALTGTPVREVQAIGAQHLWRHFRAILADGRVIFIKYSERSPPDSLRSEAAGLRWLAQAGAVPIPDVLGRDENTLVLSWLPPGSPSPAAAERFGRDLARLHSSPATFASPATPVPDVPAFGAPWPGYIASLPLDNTPETGPDAWPRWYATRRVLPFLRLAADAGTLTRNDVALVESVTARIGGLAGPAEPPSRIHGDCWSGNVLWSAVGCVSGQESAGRGWLIDPAAHGGHRETDLAMLALFGAPHLDRILAAYDEASPLADGWRARVPLHQLHPLLVHACLFGAGYAAAVRAAARRALSL